MKLRYVVAQIVPDLIRHEPINIGIILQSEEWVSSKFIQRIPKDWDIPEDLAQDVVHNISGAWYERLNQKSELIYVPKKTTHMEISHNQVAFLEWLHMTYDRHLQFSEIRGADVEITDNFGFDTFLERLYNAFVAPKPRLRKPAVKSKLHTKLKNQFKQLKLFGDIIQERYPVRGTFPWIVDFWYKYGINGTQREVAINLSDFSQRLFLERVKDIFAVWNDIKYVRGDSVEKVSVVAAITGRDEHNKALELLTRASDSVYVLDTQERAFFENVQKELEAITKTGEVFTRDQFFSDLGNITRRIN